MNVTVGKNFIGYAASAVFALGAFFSVYNGLKLDGADQALTLFISLFAVVAVFLDKRVLSYIALALMAFMTSAVVYGFFQFKENAANLFGSFGGKNELLSNFASAAVSQVTLEFGFFFMLMGTLGFAFYLVKTKSSDGAVSNDALQTKIDGIKEHALEVESKFDVVLPVEEKASSSFNEALENEAVLKKQTSDVSTSHQSNEHGRKESNVKTIALTAAIAMIIGAGSMYAYHNYDNILSFATEQIDSETKRSSVEQSELDDAINDYDNEKYESAFSKFEALANNGNAVAQAYLGYMYGSGQGVNQDYAQAVEWYRKAAEQGDAYAQHNLGNMYYKGQGIKQDYAQAVEWYRKAAEQGDAAPQNKLGNMYYIGQGIKQDYAQAVEWYRKAAEQGNAFAQYNLAIMYEKGQGVKQDYAQAVEWYRKAAEQGDEAAQYNLGYMYDKGQGVKQDKVLALAFTIMDQGMEYLKTNLPIIQKSLNKAQIDEATQIAKTWKVGDPLPTESKTWKSVDAKPKSQNTSSNSRFPAAPPAQNGYVTCRTNCMNGDCYRTYSDGKQVHFQAERKFNPFTSQFEWDSGGC